jgi:serine/threonine protein kinase/formylglycine-generating enzyme required for sulfatase activity
MTDELRSDESQGDSSGISDPESQAGIHSPLASESDAPAGRSSPSPVRIGSGGTDGGPSLGSKDEPTRLLEDLTQLKTSGARGDGECRILLPGHLVSGRYEVQSRLGRGGFGAVFRAHDRELNRTVALKQSDGLRSFVAGQVRNEAQSVASLNHPNIVAIHDLITLSDNELLIVMECLEGMTLAKRMGQSPMAVVDIVKIALQTANALEHAHHRMIVHSDLKPANLFLCENGTVKLLDFGLAVGYFPDDSGQRVGGTPGYMSPEQIRGESHRIDGRADIFSFGIVFYEMLTGSKPFVGQSTKQIVDATLRKSPAPPRQLNPGLDEELQRIILKCLEKRIVDRYLSVSDLKEDLKHWLETRASQAVDVLSVAVGQRVSRSGATSSLTLRSRGFQPYTESDAGLFLPLIPGPRDRDGVPESIRFWRRWVASDDPMTDHPVGVLYGPSGSGKTSYIRAGLLPQLDRQVLSIYVECRPGDLGGRLTQIIQARLRERASGSSLRDLLTRLRQDGSGTHGYRKLLIVLDQFESWSHKADRQQRQDLADALRQCDGTQIRALVVTRDDYWLGVRELLRWIEVPLQEGRNMASVDLLDPEHAMRILEAIGRGSGTLPAEGQPLTAAQQEFIRQAVEELASQDSVICVHLVMFAEMVRFQQWSPKGLRRSGGVVGACSLFFHELFHRSSSRSPEYRRISSAVPAILSDLIPPPDETVTAVAVPRQRLDQTLRQEGCGHLLDDALSILVDDLRIVAVVGHEQHQTSSDLGDEGSRAAATDDTGETNPRYRLAHDFLVEPINAWLDRERNRTWRGRTKSRLASLSELWSRRPIKTQLPSFVEFLSLLAGSRFQHRTEIESRYLWAAARLHAGRMSVAVIALIAFLLMTAFSYRQHQVVQESRQRELAANVDLLLNGPTNQVTRQIETLTSFGADALDAVSPWIDSLDSQTRVRARLFVQSVRPGTVPDFGPLIEQAPAELFSPILDTLRRDNGAGESLAQIAQEAVSLSTRTRAAILLAYLGDSTALESLLSGSNDATRDQTILLQGATWRGPPQPWLEMLSQHPDPQVKYHAAMVLATYPASSLTDVQASIDLDRLVNHPHAAVQGAGRHLAKHLDRDPFEIALSPPQEANWRIGPDSIPMVRVRASELTYFPNPNDSEQEFSASVERDFWIATIPVSRRFYDEFANSGTMLPDGTAPRVASIHRVLTASQRNDAREPILGLTLSEAYAFCNWLSEQEGRTPCYRYLELEVAPDGPPLNDFGLPQIPWELIATGTGYRLPTMEQYKLAVRCGYERGIPWKETKALARIGGDYSDPVGSEYCRPLFSLSPNRFGLFVNDPECGTFISGSQVTTALSLGDATISRMILRDKPLYSHSILLVQEAEVDGPDSR